MHLIEGIELFIKEYERSQYMMRTISEFKIQQS